MDDVHSLLRQQIAYYQARASEYDEWFLRQGRYDRGEEWNRQWFQEVERIRAWLDQFAPTGRVLELACGTGLWTEQLVTHAQQVTAVDAVAEVIELNRRRLRSSKVKYIQSDIFTWQPDEQYDVVFFSFWLSHVPAPYFGSFWGMVGQALQPGGRVFFVDSRFEPTSTASNHRLDELPAGTVRRKLNDGSEYLIVKIFYDREQLEKRLSTLGWKVKTIETPNYFLVGQGGR